ncbi:bifunctional oligoribonuclease/PAP phosphatase NrnA [soil metagenome]
MHDKIKQLIESSQRIVVVQADNPDADSLGSALALEHIVGDLGKDVWLYCGVNIPTYLHHLPGWDRVQRDLPKQFDLSIIVDASTYTLLEQLDKTGQLPWLKAKPSIVLDHHGTVDKPLDFATISVIDPGVASTGELIFQIAKELEWGVSVEAAEQIATSILGDTQGLTNDLTKSSTYRTMADLVDIGVNRPKLEELRRESSKMAEVIYKYKGQLIERTTLEADGRIALVMVPQDEINTYSPLYNPAALVQFDMLQISGVQLAIVIKTYDDGRITGALRANTAAPIADKLAEHLGGGGHPYASGFKITDGRTYADVKADCVGYATQLLDNLGREA